MIALDVGTRTLAAAEVEQGTIRRLVVHEHAGTPMRGGQVQDIAAVAAGIRKLREELDLPEGTPASMAIAGGLLRTESLSVTVSGPGPWTENDLRAADQDAVSAARNARRSQDRGRGDDPAELLVDLTRSNLQRDGEPVSSLAGMAGATGSWTALTSWLPLEQVRLKMEAVTAGGFFPRTITVEPLAVSAALFGSMPPPATYAVVDIGAGTSDIAVFSRSGLTEAASVPLAGDTITAAIASALSLDHLSADRLKRDPGTPVRDLWGDEKRFKAAALMEAADPGVSMLVEAIAERLRLIAPTLPSGLILVGGGSLWADLPERLARALGLPGDRVRRRGAETIPGVRDETGKVHGPAFLTLLGIILTESTSFSRRRFRRDGQRHWTLARGHAAAGESGARTGAFTVADALSSLGDDPLHWFGAPGEAHIDAESIAAGALGEPPTVTVNGIPGNLDTPLDDDDDFTIVRGSSGTGPTTPAPVPATNTITAGLSTSGAIATADSAAPTNRAVPAAVAAAPHARTVSHSRTVTLDGKPVRLEHLVDADDDAVLLEALKVHADSRGHISLNGSRLYVGERLQILKVEPGTYVSRELDPPTLGTLVTLPVPRSLELLINGVPSVLRETTRTALVDGKRRPATSIVAWGGSVSTERSSWRLYEALSIHDGPAAVAQLNGQNAPWTAEIQSGDRVEFR